MSDPTANKALVAEFIDIQDGQLVERWGRTDDLGFLQQLGIVPAMPS